MRSAAPTPRSPVPPQKHFLSTSETPFSSYSAFIIQKASLSFMMNDVHVHGATQEDQCLGHVSSLEAESPLC